MKKRIAEIISALLLGVASCHMYFLFSGIASTLTVHLIKNVGRIPQPIRQNVYWVIILIQDILFALPVIALTCFIGGYFIKHSAWLYGALLFIGFLCSYIHYHIFISFFGFVGPLWLDLSKNIIIAILFIYVTYFFVSLKQRRQNHIHNK